MGASPTAATGGHARAGVQRGALMLAAAALVFSMMSVLVKQAHKELPVEMLVMARGTVTLVLSWLLVKRRGLSPWGKHKPLLLLRGLFGLCGLVSFFYAISALPLADVTVIHFINPVLTALLAALVLREALTARLLVAIALSMSRVLLVVHPSWLLAQPAALPLNTFGVVAALAGGGFAACAYVTVRHLTSREDPLVIVLYFPLVVVPVMLPFVIAAWRWPSVSGWALMLGIGVLAQVAQVLLTRGLALLPAGRGTAIGYVQIVFAAGWGALLFDESVTWLTLAGAVLVLLGTSLLWGRRQTLAAAPVVAPVSGR